MKQSNGVCAYVQNLWNSRRVFHIEVCEPKKNAIAKARGQNNGLGRWGPKERHNVGD